jgi:hypothetical protein
VEPIKVVIERPSWIRGVGAQLCSGSTSTFETFAIFISANSSNFSEAGGPAIVDCLQNATLADLSLI